MTCQGRWPESWVPFLSHRLVKGYMPTLRTELTQGTSLSPEQQETVRVVARGLLQTQAEIKRLEADAEMFKAQLEVIRVESGQNELEVDGYKISRIQQTYQALNKEVLMSRYGLSMAQIEDATENRPKKAYTLVTGPK